jgi:hypothetical protein
MINLIQVLNILEHSITESFDLSDKSQSTLVKRVKEHISVIRGETYYKDDYESKIDIPSVLLQIKKDAIQYVDSVERKNSSWPETAAQANNEINGEKERIRDAVKMLETVFGPEGECEFNVVDLAALDSGASRWLLRSVFALTLGATGALMN